jgi:antitoxin component of MazEF toxin-antitoxin module
MRDRVHFTARAFIRKVGNSVGIVLSGEILAKLNLVEGSEVEVSLSDAGIQITPIPKKREVNKDLSTWGSQFKAAIKACDRRDD